MKNIGAGHKIGIAVLVLVMGAIINFTLFFPFEFKISDNLVGQAAYYNANIPLTLNQLEQGIFLTPTYSRFTWTNEISDPILVNDVFDSLRYDYAYIMSYNNSLRRYTYHLSPYYYLPTSSVYRSYEQQGILFDHLSPGRSYIIRMLEPAVFRYSEPFPCKSTPKGGLFDDKVNINIRCSGELWDNVQNLFIEFDAERTEFDHSDYPTLNYNIEYPAYHDSYLTISGNYNSDDSSECGDFSLITPVSAEANVEYSDYYLASKSIDGSKYTKWFGNFFRPLPQWISFDLGEEKCINGFKLYSHYNNVPFTFDVEISNDNINWTLFRSGLVANGGEGIVENYIDLNTVSARYLKIIETATPVGKGAGNLNEIEVSVADKLIVHNQESFSKTYKFERAYTTEPLSLDAWRNYDHGNYHGSMPRPLTNPSDIMLYSEGPSLDPNYVSLEEPICGDSNLSEPEECELPNTEDNEYCPQLPEKCENGVLYVRDDSYGNCNADCYCLPDNYLRTCSDLCNNGCADNSDCESGYYCNSDCECAPGSCGNGIEDPGEECDYSSIFYVTDQNCYDYYLCEDCTEKHFIFPYNALGYELMDGKDNDCDGEIDEAEDMLDVS